MSNTSKNKSIYPKSSLFRNIWKWKCTHILLFFYTGGHGVGLKMRGNNALFFSPETQNTEVWLYSKEKGSGSVSEGKSYISLLMTWGQLDNYSER